MTDLKTFFLWIQVNHQCPSTKFSVLANEKPMKSQISNEKPNIYTLKKSEKLHNGIFLMKF